MSTTTGRPSVEQVALLIRARTKDEFGNEIGTFDDTTRPSASQVEEQIDAALALVSVRVPPFAKLQPELVDAVAEVVAYRAALRVEKSYFPEQVRSDRSAYDQLHQEYLEEMQALIAAVEAGGGGDAVVESDFGNLPVGSWTSIPADWIT